MTQGHPVFLTVAVQLEEKHEAKLISATNRCILFNINAPIYALPVLSL